MYQAMTIVLACFMQLWDCINPSVPRLAFILQEALPADIVPLGKSVLLQILISALYVKLINRSKEHKREVTFLEQKSQNCSDSKKISLKKQVTLEHKNSVCSFDGTNSSAEAVALAVAETLCCIDEDNKHTEEIESLLKQAKQSLEQNKVKSDGCSRVEESLQMSELLASNLLMHAEGKMSLKVYIH